MRFLGFGSKKNYTSSVFGFSAWLAYPPPPCMPTPGRGGSHHLFPACLITFPFPFPFLFFSIASRISFPIPIPIHSIPFHFCYMRAWCMDAWIHILVVLSIHSSQIPMLLDEKCNHDGIHPMGVPFLTLRNLSACLLVCLVVCSYFPPSFFSSLLFSSFPPTFV